MFWVIVFVQYLYLYIWSPSDPGQHRGWIKGNWISSICWNLKWPKVNQCQLSPVSSLSESLTWKWRKIKSQKINWKLKWSQQISVLCQVVHPSQAGYPKNVDERLSKFGLLRFTTAIEGLQLVSFTIFLDNYNFASKLLYVFIENTKCSSSLRNIIWHQKQSDIWK